MYNELRYILEFAPIGIAKVSRDGKFIAVNARYCEITGYSETELLTRTFQQITHPDDLDSDRAEAEKLAEGDGVSYQMVKRYISKDGRTVWVSLHVHAVRDANGRFEYFLSFGIELLHLGVYVGNTQNTKVTPQTKLSIWEYVKSNPKEAFGVGSVITLIVQGKNIYQAILEVFK